MITLPEFYRAYTAVFGYPPNDEQKEALKEPPEKALFIVAGPGTGKTTCLASRILKLALVDGVAPGGILATTFTKKAAAELRSRILGWGFRIVEALQQDAGVSQKKRDWLVTIDINQALTGTIDSICDQLLRDFRDPGTQPPIMADEFVARTLMLREGLFDDGRFRDPDLDAFLHGIFGSNWGWFIGKKNDIAINLWERRYQDQVDWAEFVKNGPKTYRKGIKVLDAVHEGYQHALEERSMVDYSLLEQMVIDRLRAGQLTEFTSDLQVVLVDEYQDTNLLQECIYFELAEACGGALSVVGDDDQSLYRFRGATVELFSDFDRRYQKVFKRKPKTVFLKTNYRSTKVVIDFVNQYATFDLPFQKVRVNAKPELEYPKQAEKGMPILGMFRDGIDELSDDLAEFVHKVFRGRGYRLPDGSVIQKAKNGGDVGDCALLCSSPGEIRGGKERFPFKLQQSLAQYDPLIELFNPRGQAFHGLQLVQRLGGLLLECLDPGGDIQDQTSGLFDDIKNVFNTWRNEACDLAHSTACPEGLLTFAQGWADRDPGRKGHRWPREVPVLDLIYGLLHFFPEFHDDPEGQVYLEVFTRQVSACQQVGRFSGRVLCDPKDPGLAEKSIQELLRDFLGPIASGTIRVNEELMEAFPRDRLNVLSIHQAKGLEFPMVIVDVGSDFRSNHPSQAFKRFPQGGGVPHRLEDLVRPFTELGEPNRTDQDRAIDDLIRQYFVAYSRPEQVLMLVGLRKVYPLNAVPHVGMGWTRDGQCVSDTFPLLEI